jgi:hypothetical protein
LFRNWEPTSSNGCKGGWRYASIADWLEAHGRFWQGGHLPKGYRRAESKNCFYNSLFLGVYQRGLTYVEGYSVSSQEPYPFLHAWNVDRNGRVIDLTREAKHAGEYFGLAFPTAFVAATLEASEMTGVLDNFQQRFPLLHGDALLEQALHPDFH